MPKGASSSEIDSDRRRPKSVKYFITPIREWCEVWLKERRLWPKPYMTKIQKRCWQRIKASEKNVMLESQQMPL